jgi:hypothetical protein
MLNPVLGHPYASSHPKQLSQVSLRLQELMVSSLSELVEQAAPDLDVLWR